MIAALTALSEASQACSALTRDSDNIIPRDHNTMSAHEMSPEGAPALLVLSLGAGQAAAALVQGVEPRVAAHGRLVTL